jgi:hypothetical protein
MWGELKGSGQQLDSGELHLGTEWDNERKEQRR